MHPGGYLLAAHNQISVTCMQLDIWPIHATRYLGMGGDKISGPGHLQISVGKDDQIPPNSYQISGACGDYPAAG